MRNQSWIRGRVTVLAACMLAAVSVSACGGSGKPKASPTQPAYTPTTEADKSLPVVSATAETPPLLNDADGGYATSGGVTIWRNSKEPDHSLVIASAGQGGLRVYGLDAELVQSLPVPLAPEYNDDSVKHNLLDGQRDASGDGFTPGNFGNVSVLYGVRLPSGRADVVAVNDQGYDQVRFYRIRPSQPSAPLVDVTARNTPLVFSSDLEEVKRDRAGEEKTIYGLTAWRDPSTGRSYLVASQRDNNRLALLELTLTESGKLTYRRVRTLTMPSTFTMPNGSEWAPCTNRGQLPGVEGMVVDTEEKRLYAAQEDVGIWRMRADLTGEPKLMDKVREYGVQAEFDTKKEECVSMATSSPAGGDYLSADVEGLALLSSPSEGARMLASSQGNYSFVVYNSGKYSSTFRIVSNATEGPDGVEECDGVAAVSAPLGSRFPEGLIVIQDEINSPAVTNDKGATRENSNYKFVDIRVIDRAGLL